jgi:hypothetical protein
LTEEYYMSMQESSHIIQTTTVAPMPQFCFVVLQLFGDCSTGNVFRDMFDENLTPETSSSQEQDGRALSVLILDDFFIQRKLTTSTFGGLIDEVNWRVEGTQNGEGGNDYSMQTSAAPIVSVPDVIIVDQCMESSGGDLQGQDMVAELRRRTVFDSTVILGCSGLAAGAGPPLLLGAGCDAVWSRPLPSREEAYAQITALLEQRGKKEAHVKSVGGKSTCTGTSTLKRKHASSSSPSSSQPSSPSSLSLLSSPSAPLVSIIMPVHNAEEYLDEAFASICGQTYRPLEVVCFNDCSTDRSRTIMRSWQEKFKAADISAICLMSDRASASGPGYGRNQAIQSSRGEFVCHLGN